MTNDIPRMSEDEAVARKAIEMEPHSLEAIVSGRLWLRSSRRRLMPKRYIA